MVNCSKALAPSATGFVFPFFFSCSKCRFNPIVFDFAQQFTERFKDGGLENLISGVKNFLPTNKLFTVTRLTEALMDSSAASNQSLQETDEYIFLDPRGPRASAAMGYGPQSGVAGAQGGTRARRMAFQDSVVFMVGGAGYVEYGNLEEWAGKTGKRITYGGTEIWDPEGFVEVLQELGRTQS